MRSTSVLISGASIAGPTLAYWLHRYGFDVTVVERAPALRPGGQAVDFKGATQLTVLARMGVLDDLRARRTGTTDTRFVDADGTELAFMSGDFTGGELEIRRGDLARVLYDHSAANCEYIFGDRITGLRADSDGVHIEFEKAPARVFDLVFGADGIHSGVRRLAFGPERDHVRHRGWYYCIAGDRPIDPGTPRTRETAYAYNTPGRLVIAGGPKSPQLYMFASSELDYPRDDTAAQKRIVIDRFTGMGWRVPETLRELEAADTCYLDSISRVRTKKFTTGRVALVGDAAHGNTLAGFGTGLAVVGAYVLAGELAAAGGDHTVAFARYDEIVKRYLRTVDGANPGPFLAPKTALGIRFRNRFLGSRAFAWMVKYSDRAANDIDLRDYPENIGAR
ncbi:FAD-dependent oxidoreductase [Nocardia otitidiscaviarum]|uniref:FAD-dependent oxidoreductase n=1 Tax=Nocardia otitidiscaviarum TaxID=1823 RepID=A0A516NFY9_9NOCA|nr:FAD-dependent monooxygenase [Nocardia otitidiscaviarum]MCP9623125.1 FAD-dependent monooxygenase [Nocardia otitidiscaviarum]QDP77787.1 FAD-dependent oxidoreductase [Nocardia otitidiscaviarum]